MNKNELEELKNEIKKLKETIASKDQTIETLQKYFMAAFAFWTNMNAITQELRASPREE